MTARLISKKTILLCLVLGAVHATSFAPDPLPVGMLAWVNVFALAGLFHLVLRSPTLGAAACVGWLFGMGTFVAGLYWLTISMHFYGGMPLVLAIIALVGFCAYLALFTMLSSWLMRLLWRDSATMLRPGQILIAAFVWASAWTLGEWLRATVLTGFAWLNTAAAQVDGWISGWSALLGAYGVTFLTAWVSAVLAGTLASTSGRSADLFKGRRAVPLLVAGVICAMGAVAAQSPIGRPYGEPLVIRLVQGDIDQADKFTARGLDKALELYQSLASHQQTDQQIRPELIMLPETVMTMLPNRIPREAWEDWIEIVRSNQAILMMGSPMPGTDHGQYTNSVIAISGNDSSSGLLAGQVTGRYDKQHLVPFGEFVPFGFRWFVDLMEIPLGDFSAGVPEQKPIPVFSQLIAPNICYEDVFGQELLPAVRQGATILANFSNLGWFGNTVALRQHWQMARLRAMETRRPIVRSTNTGMTGAIDEFGQPIAMLPTMAAGYVDVRIQGRTGLTPYVRYGNTPVLLTSLLVLLAALLRRFRTSAGATQR